MLTACFSHLPGIGRATQKLLCEAGISSWDDALCHPALPFTPDLKAEFLRGLKESQKRLAAGDALWFSERLAAQEQWRLFPHFRHSVAYMDIESTGLPGPHSQITTISVYDGENLKVYVNGRNLDDFLTDIQEYQLLVTWNGRMFDVPFINRVMRTELKMAHLDLFPVFRALGIKGGLKKVEKQLGLDREELDGVDGYTAVQLWREYTLTGYPGALETLLAYNAEDVFSLEYLSYYACARHGYPVPGSATEPLAADWDKPDNPFRADAQLVARLIRERQEWEERKALR